MDLGSRVKQASDRIAKAAQIFENIRMRRLSIKAFQLQRTYPGDPLETDVRQKAGLVDFREVIEQRTTGSISASA